MESRLAEFQQEQHGERKDESRQDSLLTAISNLKMAQDNTFERTWHIAGKVPSAQQCWCLGAPFSISQSSKWFTIPGYLPLTTPLGSKKTCSNFLLCILFVSKVLFKFWHWTSLKRFYHVTQNTFFKSTFLDYIITSFLPSLQNIPFTSLFQFHDLFFFNCCYLYVRVCVCVRVHVHMCACVHVYIYIPKYIKHIFLFCCWRFYCV